MDKELFIKFNDTGICEVYVDYVVNKWNHLWVIFQYKDKYTLCRGIRKDSQKLRVKAVISEQQAREIINRLSLVQTRDNIFRHGSAWRKHQGERGR